MSGSPPPADPADAAPPRGGKARTRRFAAGVLAIAMAVPSTFAGIAVLLALAAGVLLRTPDGRETVARAVERLASVPGDMDVRLGTIGPGLPTRLELDRLVLSDQAGPWLEAGGLVFAWRPAALLRGRLHITDVGLDSLSVARLPAPDAEAPAPDTEAGFHLPDLPVAITVDRLHLDDVRLDAAVAGQPLHLGLEGRLGAAAAGGRLETSLAVERRDGGSGGLRLQAGFDPASRGLGVEAAFDEPEGGLVTGLLGLADRPALSLSLSGDGPVDDWRGTFTAAADGVARISADLSLRAGDALRLETTGRAAIEANPVPALRPALADGVRFEAALRRSADDTLSVDALSLDADGLRLVADARLDPDGKTVAAAAELTIEERALATGSLGPARFSAGRVQVTAKGPLDAPVVDAQATIDAIAAPEASAKQLELQVHATPGAPQTAAGPPGITATGRFSGLHVQSPPLAAALGPSPTLALQADFDQQRSLLTLRELTLDGRAVRLAGNGTFGLESGALAAQADLVLPDLQPIGTAAGLRASGEVRLAAKVEGNLQPPALQGSVGVRTSRLVSGIAAADALLGPEPLLDSALAYSEARGAEVQSLRLAARHVRAEGRAALSADAARLDSQIRVEVPSLAPLSAPLGTALRGSAVVDATASGNPADPSAVVTARLSDVVAGTTRIERARAELRATTLGSRPAGRLDAEAVSADLGPLSANVAFVLEQGRMLRLDPIAARAAGVRVTGDVRADLQTNTATGRLNARSEAPQTGVRVGEMAVTGPLQLDVRLIPVGPRQMVTADLRAGPLALLQSAAEQARIGSLSGEATVTNALASPEITATIEAKDLAFSGRHLQRIQASADGTPARLRVGVAASGRGASPDRIEAGAILSAEGGATRIELDRLQGRLAGLPLALQQPARFTSSAAGRLELRDLAVTLGDGRIEAGGRLGPGETSADLQVTALPVRLAKLFAPSAPAGGTADLTAALRSERADTVGDVTMRLNDVAVTTTPTGEATVDADLTLRLADRRLALQGSVAGPQGSTASVSGQLPVRLPAGQPQPLIDRDAPMDGRLQVAADIGKLGRLLALDDQRIEGRIDGDFTIAGSLANPDLQGGLTLAEGLYENFVSGTLLSGLAARVEPTGPRTIAVKVTGNDGGSGRIGVDGTVGVDDAGQPRADITVTADQATLVRRDDVTATTNAEITYSTTLEPPRLAGRIETTEVVVRLVNRLPPSVVELPVIEIGRPETAPSGAARVAAAVAIAIGLEVAMPHRVFVRGRGLESEWEGALSVGGTTAKPRVSGSIGLIRGTFSFAGKRFDLQRGSITFTGGQPIDPIIDAFAEYRASTITAQIHLGGLASKPEITVTSQPPLPESEVLAQVLFGKSSAKLGPVEAVQLAAAVEALARGESTSENAFDFVRTLLGLDTLAVQPSSSGEGSSVAVGRYVGDRVYIGAQQGIEDGSQTGSVEIEIAPGISIESEIGQSTTSGTQGALGLKWKWDY